MTGTKKNKFVFGDGWRYSDHNIQFFSPLHFLKRLLELKVVQLQCFRIREKPQDSQSSTQPNSDTEYLFINRNYYIEVKLRTDYILEK